MTDTNLLKKLQEDGGFGSLEDMLESFTFNSCYGICKTCHNTMQCEPDATQNWCDECDSGTVVSGLILAGII